MIIFLRIIFWLLTATAICIAVHYESYEMLAFFAFFIALIVNGHIHDKK